MTTPPPPPPDATRRGIPRGVVERATTVGSATSGDLTPQLIATSVWSDQLVTDAGIPVIDVPVVTVGGGFGSFVLVDYLRIAGVIPEDIRVLGAIDAPWETYKYLAANSQIPDHERLRSDSSSMPDNIWGFPSYAVREAFASRSLSGFLKPLWNVFTEPIVEDYYTPKAGQVYDAVDREARRIGFRDMLDLGQVRMVRRRHGGGYFVILTPRAGTTATKRVAYRCRHVHLSLGYPGVRFLPDLQAYREKHQDFGRVVAAYEPHDHVYRSLLRKPGTVMVRGSGIVASRILQRLLDDREQNGAQTTVWHVFRSFVDAPQRSKYGTRPGAGGFAYQGFNYPKAAWGGQLRDQLLAMPADQRREFLAATGGTNTAPRKSWRQQLARGANQGFYRHWVGSVEEVAPGEHSDLAVRLSGPGGSGLSLEVDYIIDATGLEADIRENRVLADLLDHSDARTNPLGRLDVTPDFVVSGADSQPGRMYASGSITLGGPYAPVDSFLGLQYSALQILEDLAKQGMCRRIGPIKSVSEWFKWMGNRPI